MNLLVDIGNTRLKWATGHSPDNLNPGQIIPNAELSTDSLKRLWRIIGAPKQVVVSQVGSSDFLEQVKSTARELWPDIEIITVKSAAFAHGLTNGYQDPESLGIDRWLGILAAYHKYKQALCVVGCGTAITLDIVDNSGQHLGGLISPGLHLMKQVLAIGTAKLAFSSAHYHLGLANHTEAAIYNGTLAAACGLIDHTLKNYPVQMPLILTGGDAEVIAKVISRQVIIEPNLVLRGLTLT